jgi:hypothetical protein
MTFTVTKEFVYFVICGVLLVMQVLQRRKLDKVRKDLDHVTNTLMILFFNVKQHADEQKEKGVGNGV